MRIFTVLFLISILNSCVTLFNSEHELFQIKDIYYQSWVVKDLEKGTDVIIEMKNLNDEVEFTSLIFRGIEVDVNIKTEGSKTIVKGTINTGPSLIENYEYKSTGSDNMIKYNYKDEEFSYPLTNIKRESTRFIK
ncbi:MAG: hypothetical protein ACQERS_08860 [Bacteroidota bacterium]